MSKINKIGAAWKKTSASKNQEYLNVKITKDIPAGSYLQIWKNDRKTGNAPDYNVVIYIKAEK